MSGAQRPANWHAKLDGRRRWWDQANTIRGHRIPLTGPPHPSSTDSLAVIHFCHHILR